MQKTFKKRAYNRPAFTPTVSLKQNEQPLSSLIFAPIWVVRRGGGTYNKGGIQIYLNHVEVESRARKGCVQPDLTLN